MKTTYLTTSELAERIKYDARTIRNQLKDSVLLECIHYIRPFGGRKILYLWEQIEVDMFKAPAINSLMMGIRQEARYGKCQCQKWAVISGLSL